MFSTGEIFTLKEHDKKIIREIVVHYSAGERVRTIRNIFKAEASTDHFLYLGFCIGKTFQPDHRLTDRMQMLSYRNN